MKSVKKIADGANFSAADFGKLNELGDYVLELGPDVKIPGKVFGGAALQTTGADFSLQVFQPGTETGFLHTHKTHEEANFLMETRWMLYMEEEDTLQLFRVIPRRWMEEGKSIELTNVQSYFGTFDVKVVSHVREGRIEAVVKCNDNARKPACIKVRLPHPEEMLPNQVTGGDYDPETETVTLSPFNREAHILLEF